MFCVTRAGVNAPFSIVTNVAAGSPIARKPSRNDSIQRLRSQPLAVSGGVAGAT